MWLLIKLTVISHTLDIFQVFLLPHEEPLIKNTYVSFRKFNILQAYKNTLTLSHEMFIYIIQGKWPLCLEDAIRYILVSSPVYSYSKRQISETLIFQITIIAVYLGRPHAVCLTFFVAACCIAKQLHYNEECRNKFLLIIFRLS